MASATINSRWSAATGLPVTITPPFDELPKSAMAGSILSPDVIMVSGSATVGRHLLQAIGGDLVELISQFDLVASALN
jgi:hypothetical protein